MLFLFAKLDIIKWRHKLKGTVQDANVFLKTVFADCYYKKKSPHANLEKLLLRLWSTVSVYPAIILQNLSNPWNTHFNSYLYHRKYLGTVRKPVISLLFSDSSAVHTLPSINAELHLPHDHQPIFQKEHKYQTGSSIEVQATLDAFSMVITNSFLYGL